MGVKIRKKDGKWYLFINWQKHRQAKMIGTDRRLAEQVKKQVEAQIALGQYRPGPPQGPSMLFSEYAHQWLEGYVPLACKPSAQRIMHSVVRNHLLPAFGTTRLDALSRSQIRAVLQAKARTHARGYVQRIGRVLHTLLAQAVEEGLLPTNPATRLGVFVPEGATARTIDPFTSAELTQYLAAMQERSPQHYPYFLTLARTGMREGEALGLYWEDIQFGLDARDQLRCIHIRRTWDAVHKRYSTPKSGTGRVVAMSQGLRAVLLEMQLQRVDAAHLSGQTTIEPVVFCGPSGQPYHPSWLHHLHKRACAAAGLRATRIHDLRHSYATILLYELHAPIQEVSAQLGHANIQLTVNTYGHPKPGRQTALVDQLDGKTATGAQRHSEETV